MKIVLPGGTGQIGTLLARQFHAEGHDVVVFSRTPRAAPWRVAPWNGQTLGVWADELEGADVLINLAGRIVNCRYNHRNRCEIWSSRTRSVRVLGNALAAAQLPSASVAASQHRDDLCPSLRRPER
jgi:hypothetical protein